ncbi:MAG: MmgE/PrpD family protein [Acidiferrobacterales bacterium]
MGSESRSVSQIFAEWVGALTPDAIPPEVRATAESALLDFTGLCIAARESTYVRALLDSWDGEGACTAIGHGRQLDAAGVALVNGTAAHGEDYDDTFEGTPVHAGSVVIPAVLAACERYGRSGRDALCGIVSGAEFTCRMALVSPAAIHRAGFHPTAVIGALGATAGVGAALALTARQLTNGLGVAGSMAAGIIEYLAEGTWTKRLHAGWAAQSGLRAALLGQHDFLGPRTVLEGKHGFFHAFTDRADEPDFTVMTEALGDTWRMRQIAFKPYACGTMAHPFIDCAIRLANEGIDAADIEDIVCKVGEGTVHRLWEPLSEKRNPSTSYSAKFSVPFCIAVAFIDRTAGLGQFTDDRVTDPNVRALASRIRYEIDPANEYPRNYTGDLKLTLKDGTTREVRQSHLRGGAREPLRREELVAKFHANVSFAGWPAAKADAIEAFCASLFDAPDVSGLQICRA